MTRAAIAAMLPAVVQHSRRPKRIVRGTLPPGPANWLDVYDEARMGPEADWLDRLPELYTLLRDGPAVGSVRELSILLGQEQFTTQRMMDRLTELGLFRDVREGVNRQLISCWPPDPR